MAVKKKSKTKASAKKTKVKKAAKTKAKTKKAKAAKAKPKTKAKAKSAKAKKPAVTRKISSAKSKSASSAPRVKSFSPEAPTPKSIKLNVGDLAPNFNLLDQSGQSVSLSQFAGKKVVLYFYPKDDTPGCTKEACSFRDNIQQFGTKDAVILGVSADDSQSHQAFIQKYGLNFTLLADTDKAVSEAYGVWVEKNMYGKTYMGIERTTFLINPDGRIAEIFRQVKVDGHTEEVLEALAKIA